MADYTYRIAKANRVRDAREKIRSALDGEGKRVFGQQELVKLFRSRQDDWWILSGTTPTDFIEYLERELNLKKVVLEGPTHSQKFLRYLWREPSAIEVAAA